MAPAYLWLKGLHVAFMVTWFAGLLYLPRLFTYHARTADAVGRGRFESMEKRLFVIMTIAAAVTVLFGYLLAVLNTSLLSENWLRVKLVLVVGLIVYHYRCYGWIVRLRGETDLRDARWLRWFGEIPAVFLLAIVLLAIVRPF